MLIKGNYNEAIVYTDVVDELAQAQLKTLCDQPFMEGKIIRVMPDVHAGMGCVIGFTAKLGDIVIPNIVGVDIGCGMLTVKLGRIDIDYIKLDAVIREHIPSGTSVHEGRIACYDELQDLNCYRELKDTKRIERSIGTLGGGNHFIEIDTDEEGEAYLIVHTGSRNLGTQVADYYQKLAYNVLRGSDKLLTKRDELIAEYKATGRKDEIQSAVKKLYEEYDEKESDVPKEISYLTGIYADMYRHDMHICQSFAALNRYTIADVILRNMFGCAMDDADYFETIHNYIDMDDGTVRKGAVSAKKGEKLLIPINMRDGSLICIGKGNDEWNNSAPHGAGRLYKRSSAREKLSLEEFRKEMEGIYSTSVSVSTLDESPMAYKSVEDILPNIEPTVQVVKRIKSVYNFKAS